MPPTPNDQAEEMGIDEENRMFREVLSRQRLLFENMLQQCTSESSSGSGTTTTKMSTTTDKEDGSNDQERSIAEEDEAKLIGSNNAISATQLMEIRKSSFCAASSSMSITANCDGDESNAVCSSLAFINAVMPKLLRQPSSGRPNRTISSATSTCTFFGMPFRPIKNPDQKFDEDISMIL